MNRQSALILVAVLIAGLSAMGVALAQGMPSIRWWAIGGGGAPSRGDGIRLNDSLGQPFIGPSRGDSVSMGAGYWYARYSAPALTLVSFNASVQGQAVLLTWETASEVEIEGFHLYRAEAPDGTQTRLNEALIPSQGQGGPPGASYQFADEDVVAGVTYWYWLEAVDIYGEATRHGPESAAIPAADAYHIYLPVVRR
jgi:hypothetical protein